MSLKKVFNIIAAKEPISFHYGPDFLMEGGHCDAPDDYYDCIEHRSGLIMYYINTLINAGQAGWSFPNPGLFTPFPCDYYDDWHVDDIDEDVLDEYMSWCNRLNTIIECLDWMGDCGDPPPGGCCCSDRTKVQQIDALDKVIEEMGEDATQEDINDAVEGLHCVYVDSEELCEQGGEYNTVFYSNEPGDTSCVYEPGPWGTG